MHDFTPLWEIVTVGYQLNDGTHVHANSPFADRKLSWKAAILVQRRTAGKGRLIEGMMAGRRVRDVYKLGGISWRNRNVIIWRSSRLREHKMDTVRKHTENWLDMRGEIKYCNVIWAVAIWGAQPVLWKSQLGDCLLSGKRCEIWLQLSNTKRIDLQRRCLKWAVNWWREDEREWDTEGERS